MPETRAAWPTTRQLLNKVPEITLYFWVIKVLCTTVGETASDYLTDNVGLGLSKTTLITGAVLITALFFQFRASRYVAGIYWLAVVLISIVGTQITDNLSDNLGVSLVITTVGFSIVLAAVFVCVTGELALELAHAPVILPRPAWAPAAFAVFNITSVSAIVGSYASAICLATTQAAAKYNIPHLVDVGVADQIVERGLKNTFRF